ncbi:hypothetical protein [uncultured Roseobacter sp.]|uniref:hypothetical protein n=1 Tax=uncultured Roseobacter sp. TaxID=114847 RepID=UPI00262FB117|nr:hypothetical protein [uncultured Roseobacter sp.]
MPPMLALYLWPAISAVILRNMRLPLAILVVIFAGYMFLPVKFAIDFPMIPPMDKHAIPVMTIMAGVLLFATLRESAPNQPGLLPKSLLARILIGLVVLGAIGTAITNGDRIVTPQEVKRPLSLYDGVSMAIGYVILILPVLIGRKYFARAETHRLILIVFCIAACIYALPALFEVRMSPRLNRWIYGFTPHDWRMHVRGGGWRPMVFLEHGLRVSLFFALGLIAAVGLFRMGWKVGFTMVASAGLAVTLVLTKSLGAVIIAALIVPLVFFLNTRLLILAAAVIGTIVLTYPILRGGGYVPIDKALELAARVDEKRAGSLRVRVENEEIMLARAAERPVFGWGGFGRSRVRNEKGNDITTADGYWVIMIGRVGWVHYIGEFGLMTAPMVLLFLQRRRLGITRDTAILSIIVAANMIDLIPNSGHSPILFLIVGALWGRLERGPEDDDGEGGLDPPEQDGRPQGEDASRYARDFGKKPVSRQRPLKTKVERSTIHPRYRRDTGQNHSAS